MLRLIALAVALLASLVLYLAVFAVVHRPLTLGDIPRQLAFKTAYARTLPSPKVLIFAGSNGRYSHRCAPITTTTGLPCANVSIAVGIGLDFLLAQIEPLLNPGDVVYMPLEYGQYLVTRSDMEGGAQNPVLVHDLRDQLWQLPLPRIARALASFDLPFLVHGLVEMSLARTGFERRTTLATLTPQGDESGHTESASRAYRTFLQTSRFTLEPLPPRSHAIEVIGDFLERSRARGVVVVGGLQTVPDSVVLDDATVERLDALYSQHGQQLLVLGNRSQYPLSCFFDTLSHLNEPCQLRHSELVGAALAERLGRHARTGQAR